MTDFELEDPFIRVGPLNSPLLGARNVAVALRVLHEPPELRCDFTRFLAHCPRAGA